MIEEISQAVKKWIAKLAKPINDLSGGRIKPNHITALSLLGHILIAALIVSESWNLAALMLIIFGLMDSLDGALARLQRSASAQGMINDAAADRLKEILIYLALLIYFSGENHQLGSILTIVALSGSFMVTFIKTKGEAAISSSKQIGHQRMNRIFAGGWAPYHLRMSVLIVGLLLGSISATLLVISILAWTAALDRYARVQQVLS